MTSYDPAQIESDRASAPAVEKEYQAVGADRTPRQRWLTIAPDNADDPARLIARQRSAAGHVLVMRHRWPLWTDVLARGTETRCR